MVLTTLSSFIDVVPLAVRITVGVLMIVHGAPKLFGPARSQMREGMKMAGIPGGLFDLVGLLEFLGGIALLIGFLTRLVSLLFILEMIGTIILYNTVLWKMPLPRGALEQAFKQTHGYMFGWELDTLVLSSAIVTLILGGGAFSIDAILRVEQLVGF
jgi:putative oxidoreductase